jgi:hypothetical protein
LLLFRVPFLHCVVPCVSVSPWRDMFMLSRGIILLTFSAYTIE